MRMKKARTAKEIMQEPDKRYTLGAYAMLALAVAFILWSSVLHAQILSRMPQDAFSPDPEPKVSVTRVYPFLVPLAARVQDGDVQWGSGLGLSYRTSSGDHAFLASWIQSTWKINYGHPNSVEVAWKVNLR